jgi:hypothetical protein
MSDTLRIYLPLEVRVLLAQDALRDQRTPEAQAAWLLRSTLDRRARLRNRREAASRVDRALTDVAVPA